MDIIVERVTPAKAAAYLNSNKANRSLREGVVERYASDMANDRWTNCPEPISFYDDGDLADGQHRLFAIVESGKTITFPVARGLKRQDGLNLNTGLGRTLIDNAKISGADSGLSHDLIAASRACAEGEPPAGRLSNAQRLEMVELNREACEWAVKNGPRGKYLRNAVILAAVARAFIHEPDKGRLRRFSDVLTSGLMNGEDEMAAIILRNYLLSKAATTSSAAMWRDSFLKIQNAIRYFMLGRKLAMIKAISDEAYPLKGKTKSQSKSRSYKR